MSLQAAAKHLASKGRGPDTHLVHMAPSEVEALQKLAKAHGGSLTINPDTGLPEAGFLSSVLPMAIGAGLSIASGGALTPMMGAMITGAGYGLASGNLMKGLQAGLGAYGGASLLGGLAAPALTSEAGLTSGAEALGTTKDAFMANPDQYFLSQAPSNPAGYDAFGNTPGAAGYDMSTSGAMADPAKQKAFTDEYSKVVDAPYLDRVNTGLSAAIKDPSKYVDAMGGGLKTAQAGLMAASPLLTQTPKMPGMAAPDSSMGQRYRYTPGRANPFPSASPTGVEQNYFPGSGYAQITNDQAKQLYGYADGGMTYGLGDAQGDPNLMQVKTFDPVVRMADGGTTYDPATQQYSGDGAGVHTHPSFRDSGFGSLWNLMMQNVHDSMFYDQPTDSGMWAQFYPDKANNPATPNQYTYDPGTQTYTGMASGGISHLGDFSDGGRLLRGPGDGVSDSIPATIGGKRPARLADGEFVVPARIVSELGNGSTEAGARKLYAMMDRVQKTRSKTVGKGKVAVNSRADKALPA